MMVMNLNHMIYIETNCGMEQLSPALQQLKQPKQELTPTPNGSLAAIGFNSKMFGYYTSGMPRVLHASTVMGADVVNCSWMSAAFPSPGIESTYLKIIKEVLNNGTVIVAAAGNGFCGSWYNDDQFCENCTVIPPDFQYFSAPYPFNPKYDSTIILVTSTDKNDNHTLYGDTVVYRTHSHFPEVDICSPGHNLMGAALTLDTLNGDTAQRIWPYYGSFGGTSFAAPIASGVCALIKSINPCLTPALVEEIIKITADPVNDEYLYHNLLGAGRINAYQAVKYAQDNFGYEEYVIGNGQDITWYSEIQAKKITIESGGKLTIKSTVFLLPESDILVFQGGNLVVDGGHLTTCKGLWNGIQVYGNHDLDQYTFGNQGHLSLIHGAIIENAKTGVLLAESDGRINPNYTGGIVQAMNSSFINCVNGVSFYRYENYLNSVNNIKNNLSYLNCCTFKLDTNYNHVFFTPKMFIFMDGVRGIPIKGCTFVNEIKSADYQNATEINPDEMIGIVSANSSFIVNEYCLHQVVPCDTSVVSRFENLKYGIYAVNYGSEKYPYIANSDFIRNKTGVYLGAINNAVVNSNFFSVRQPHDDNIYGNPDPTFVGIYSDNCSGYSLEENDFESNYIGPLTASQTLGMVINNSGPYANEVYKNNFNRIRYGIIAMNQNKRDSVGLCIKCNDFAYCEYDVSVVIDTAVRGWGIAEHQGSRDNDTKAPAGNVFTSNFTCHVFDLYNDAAADPFTYFHHNEALTPLINVEPDPLKCSPSVSLSLNDQRYDPERSCPSRLGGGGGSLLEKSKMDDAENQIATIEGTLASLVDGGNTPGLTLEVVTSTPPEALDLSQQLLSESPYLSDTVMKTAIVKEEVLTNAMIRDVLVENPQSAKSDDIMQMLDNRMDPMPDYMKGQIEQGKFTTGDKENLEANRSYYLAEQTRCFNNLNRIYQSDSTISYRLDSLVVLFEEMNTLENQYRKAFIHLENSDTALMTDVLNSVPDDFPLTIEQSITHQKYQDLIDVLKDLTLNDGSVLALDSVQIAELLDIYDNETLPGIYARNILVTAGYLTYPEPYLFPDNLKQMEIKPNSQSTAYDESINLKVFPNPASYYTIVEFDVPRDENIRPDNLQIIINVRDVLSNNLKKLYSSQHFDQLVLDVRDMKSGLYFVDLILNGQRRATNKLIVNH
jgi:hypothetical protein